MIRKMKIGTLGGAVFTNRGITSIYPDFYVLSIPFFIRSEDELNFVTGKMDKYFEKKIEERGYKVLIWSMAGWVQFFTKKPVLVPDDLKKHKLSFATGEPKMEQAWKRAGYQVIPNELKDLMMALKSGMVDAFYLPALVAASGQYFALAPNLASIKVAPLYGGIVLSNKIWRRIPEELKPELLKAGRKISKKLYLETKKLEKEAIKTMVNNGLKINNIDEKTMKKWYSEANRTVKYLIGRSFSKEIYEKVRGYLKEFREKK
jgi:TRAP-type C4-dicarboxylate transport system substrate-binding protein